MTTRSATRATPARAPRRQPGAGLMSADTYVGDVAAAETVVRLPRGGTAVAVAAAASLVAATVHAVVVPEHLAHGWLHGAFLAVVAVAQVVLAWVVLRRPTVAAVVLGLCGTIGVVLLYVASRTVGLPVAFGSAPESHSSHGGRPGAPAHRGHHRSWGAGDARPRGQPGGRGRRSSRPGRARPPSWGSWSRSWRCCRAGSAAAVGECAGGPGWHALGRGPAARKPLMAQPGPTLPIDRRA